MQCDVRLIAQYHARHIKDVDILLSFHEHLRACPECFQALYQLSRLPKYYQECEKVSLMRNGTTWHAEYEGRLIDIDETGTVIITRGGKTTMAHLKRAFFRRLGKKNVKIMTVVAFLHEIKDFNMRNF